MGTRKGIFFTCVILVVFALRYWIALPEFDFQYAAFYIGRTATLKGIVISEPQEGEFFTQFKIKLAELNGCAIIRTTLFSNVDYGDIIEFTGKLEKPINNDPRIAVFVNKPAIKIIKKADGINMGLFIKSKNFLVGRLNKIFPYPTSSFASGILLGDRSEIPSYLTNDFKKAGLTHILALSGYNIVILIVFVTSIMSFLPRKIANWASLIVVAAFVLLVGAGASVVRAAIMGSLTIVARMVGRQSVGLRPLLIAGFTMALIDPFIIFYDIGFQLSFAATAGIILFTGFIRKKWQHLPETIASTWSSQVFTLPIIIWYFNGFSLIATLSNIIVLPFIPILMFGSFLSIILGKTLAAPVWLLFELVIRIIHILASLPFAFFEVPIDLGIS